jgi:apolipoprotein N-acyltransferase
VTPRRQRKSKAGNQCDPWRAPAKAALNAGQIIFLHLFGENQDCANSGERETYPPGKSNWQTAVDLRKCYRVNVPNPESKIQNLKSLLAAALSGILLVACFPKLDLAGLVWVAATPLFWALSHKATARQSFLIGYVCGIFFFAGSCYWFVTVVEFYGHLAPILAYITLVLFVLLDATFFGGLGLAIGWAARRSPTWALALSPLLWIGMELARTYLITGFPWNLLGYAVHGEGLRQIASVTGVYGLSFLAAVTSALIAWVLISPRYVRAGLTLLAFAVILTLGNWWLMPPPPSQGKELAVLIQPNVPLDENELENWIPWRNPAQLQQLVDFSVTAAIPIQNPRLKIQNPRANPPLLVWAENPAPFYFTRDPVFRNAMENMARQAHSIVITNTIVPVDGTTDSITNTAVTLDPEGREVSRYDKIHLVPFGEYVPWWAFPGLIHKVTTDIGNFVPGTSYPVARFSQGNIGVFICYEAILPQLARHLVANGANVLVNISNDAWYGDSAAAYQHLQISRLRAIENHRYLLRATDNGVTAFIDPYGRVIETLPRYQRLALLAHFDYEQEETFYTAHGDLFAWTCASIGVVLLLAGAFGRSKRST